jgi:hypothetical protein
LIEKTLKISQYKIDIIGGKQPLQLISDKEGKWGVSFINHFIILNSSDKSRRLGL